jgi:voltage-gated potassium channel
MQKLKEKIFGIIEEDVSDSLAHKIFEVFIVTLIILNVFAIIFESYVNVKGSFFRIFENFSVAVFTIEYVLRFWTADVKYSGYSKLKSRLKFISSPMGIIDVLSILPFYIGRFAPILLDGRILRVLRLLRLLRILKLSRFLDSFSVIRKVIKKRRYELLITGFIAFILIVVASTLMFEVENEAQPDKFPDIISSFWWAIATLTTIGYGDVFPVTGLGKFISAVVSLIGIGLIALPTGILSTSFIEEFRNINEEEKEKIEDKINYCPYCGKKLDDHR